MLIVAPAVLCAQAVCDEGQAPLDRARPQGLPPDEIIHKFSAQEALFAQARLGYSFTRDLTVQTLSAGSVSGELRQVAYLKYDPQGRLIENIRFQPQSTLTRITMTEQDMQEFRALPFFVFSAAELQDHKVEYAGTQQIDEIGTYVFDVTPTKRDKNHPRFEGRIWVDDHDLAIVKTCGNLVPQPPGQPTLRFVIYRELIDARYWFPTYARADQLLSFPRGGDVRVRAVIKFTDYRQVAPAT